MKSFLNPESPPMKFLTAIGYAACLNCFWFLCCLPVVTAGASTTALYDVMQKVVLSEESRIISSFFSSFRKNWSFWPPGSFSGSTATFSSTCASRGPSGPS